MVFDNLHGNDGWKRHEQDCLREIEEIALVKKSDVIRLTIESDGVRIVTAFYDLLTGVIEYAEDTL